MFLDVAAFDPFMRLAAVFFTTSSSFASVHVIVYPLQCEKKQQGVDYFDCSQVITIFAV